VVESSGLLNRRSALKRYRGFESPPLRQIISMSVPVDLLAMEAQTSPVGEDHGLIVERILRLSDAAVRLEGV
jgi:hypothetical protein